MLFKKALENIYVEKLLLNEFTFGFELEAYAPIQFLANVEKQFDDGVKTNRSHHDVVKQYINNLFEDNSITFTGKSRVSTDASLTTADDELRDEIDGTSIHDLHAFEFSSPVINFSPSNVLGVVKILNTLLKNDFITTDECGFHIHIGFPSSYNGEETDLLMIWIILNMAKDYTVDNQKFLQEVVKFGDFKMYDDSFASILHIELLSDTLKDLMNETPSAEVKDALFTAIKERYSSRKFNLFRIHPQGTLEWRGPRRFLNKNNLSSTKKFFISKLYPLIMRLSAYIDKDEIALGNLLITKDDVLDNVVMNHQITVKEKSKSFARGIDRNVLSKILSRLPFMRPSQITMKNASLDLIDDGRLLVKKGEFKDGSIDNAFILQGNFKNIIITKTECNNPSVSKNDCEFLNCSFLDRLCLIENCYVKGSHTIRVKRIKNSILNFCSIDKVEACSYSKLHQTDIYGGDYDRCEIYNKCQIKNGNFDNCSFDSCSFEDGYISNSKIYNSMFYQTDEVKLTNCKLIGCSFENEDTEYRFNKAKKDIDVTDYKVKS